jgi:hypothetical protein
MHQSRGMTSPSERGAPHAYLIQPLFCITLTSQQRKPIDLRLAVEAAGAQHAESSPVVKYEAVVLLQHLQTSTSAGASRSTSVIG